MFQFLKANRIKADQLLEDTQQYLVRVYKQKFEIFSYSTSFGQILLVTKNLFSLVLVYLQDIAIQNNIHTANRKLGTILLEEGLLLVKYH